MNTQEHPNNKYHNIFYAVWFAWYMAIFTVVGLVFVSILTSPIWIPIMFLWFISQLIVTIFGG